jgi:ribonuclease T1
MPECIAAPGCAIRVIVALTAIALMAAAAPVVARTPLETLPEVALAQLPREALECLARIQRGGPFPYERDGVAFGNRERLLPAMPRGYYREYTVATPGAWNRGARRIVCGGERASPDVCYYTADHYRSFRRIRE